MTLETHLTRVSRGPRSTYIVTCDVCGTVGQPQDYEVDAEVIAARHQEIGGFERPVWPVDLEGKS